VEVGDLIKHRFDNGARTGIVTKISRNGPPGTPVHVTAVWSADWITGRSIEQQYLKVINASR
jgi:hypothetical protein